MSQGFIEQTAIDYDMEISAVQRIAELYPEQFYEKLEEYIQDRTNRNN